MADKLTDGMRLVLMSRYGVLPASMEAYRARMEDEREREVIDGRIYIEGVLTDQAERFMRWGERATDARMVREQLQEQSGDLEVWLNSPGGDVPEASAIATELRDYDGGLTCVITGICASAATFVPLTCLTTEMFETAEYLIHLPRSCMCGTATQLRTQADFLDETAANVAAIYAEKTGMSVAEVTAVMEESKKMAAKEAVEMGFADALRPIIPEPAPAAEMRTRLDRILMLAAAGAV